MATRRSCSPISGGVGAPRFEPGTRSLINRQRYQKCRSFQDDVSLRPAEQPALDSRRRAMEYNYIISRGIS
jgi:hypothetical protein